VCVCVCMEREREKEREILDFMNTNEVTEYKINTKIPSTYMAAHNSLTPVPEDQMFSPGLHKYQAHK
jgi:hypothetical protein